MWSEDDIVEGLVLHLDPDVLEKSGGSYNVSKEIRVKGGHFFLCVQAGDDDGEWMPLFSSPSKDRVVIPFEGRTGDMKWVKGAAHLHPGQTWKAKHAAILLAAKAGKDISGPSSPRTLSPWVFRSLLSGNNPKDGQH